MSTMRSSMYKYAFAAHHIWERNELPPGKHINRSLAVNLTIYLVFLQDIPYFFPTYALHIGRKLALLQEATKKWPIVTTLNDRNISVNVSGKLQEVVKYREGNGADPGGLNEMSCGTEVVVDCQLDKITVIKSNKWNGRARKGWILTERDGHHLLGESEGAK